ncbi:hypothetical protein ZWY2020_044335 [Hordeum vulgare]|nr:hypothetical protein ZWY2020_044335 [Hordeum vulgare]
MREELHDKEFKLPYQNPSPCTDERAGCVECYRSNTQDPVKCAVAVKRFEACVRMVRRSGTVGAAQRVGMLYITRPKGQQAAANQIKIRPSRPRMSIQRCSTHTLHHRPRHFSTKNRATAAQLSRRSNNSHSTSRATIRSAECWKVLRQVIASTAALSKQIKPQVEKVS